MFKFLKSKKVRDAFHNVTAAIVLLCGIVAQDYTLAAAGIILSSLSLHKRELLAELSKERE